MHECIFILVEFVCMSDRYRFARIANAFANNRIVCSAMSTIHSHRFYECDGNSLEEELNLTDIIDIFQFGIELNPVNTSASKSLKIYRKKLRFINKLRFFLFIGNLWQISP